MEFGIQFFPDVTPEEKSGAQYWTESLHLAGLCDAYGYSHVRTVEHYGHPYGGYSPNPVVFLAAAAERTRRARLVTGAILPVFNHPLKVAGEIGMLDAISGGRLDVGFARAFLPHEFRKFGRPLDESRARFDEGIAQVRALLETENVTMAGRFHSFENVTSLPRPTQRPRPPIWIAASSTDESFLAAGRNGYFVMTFPRAHKDIRRWLEMYRASWAEAGHPGRPKVMIAFHMFCAADRGYARALARPRVNAYLHSLVDASSDWGEGTTSKDYPNHPAMIEILKKANFDAQVANSTCWVGSPADLIAMIHAYHDAVGGIDIASLQVNFNTTTVTEAEASMRLFATDVMPAVAHLAPA
ncbi:MAG: LLM class flavin-dependent oxidoreductase [Alphaproteobacteria bacterium]|nr:LLM class flavin-dependent oxidoreductase [Alphaproteobacteria bacterium]